ncbi:hypothetical protein SAM19_00135 [Brevibacillus laterosporus]|nr:hypothetical protein [Brevibacillus laterosporus]
MNFQKQEQTPLKKPVFQLGINTCKTISFLGFSLYRYFSYRSDNRNLDGNLN